MLTLAFTSAKLFSSFFKNLVILLFPSSHPARDGTSSDAIGVDAWLLIEKSQVEK